MNEAAWKELWASFGGVDEPSREAGLAIRRLLTDLGGPRPDPGQWPDYVEAVWNAGPAALLARLDHPDRWVRRVVLQVLALHWQDAEQALPALLDRLPDETDAPTRAGLVLAAARLAAVLPDPAEHAAAVGRLRALLAPRTDPATRFAAALGLARHTDPEPGAVREIVDALADTMDSGAERYEEYWGDGWEYAFESATEALADGADQAELLIRVRDVVRRTQAWARVSVTTVLNSPADTLPLVVSVAGLLEHPDADVRHDAAFHLGWLPGAMLTEVAEQLAAALGDSSPSVRGYAAQALARAGDPRALPAVAGLLADEGWAVDEEVFEAVTDQAEELLPIACRRLSALSARPCGLDRSAGYLVAGLGQWGYRAAPALPELDRLVTDYRRLLAADPGEGPRSHAEYSLRSLRETADRIRDDGPWRD